MRVTLDCLVGKDVDETWTFLSAFAAELTISGHDVFDGSEGNRFSGMQNVNQLHEYASNSNLAIKADKVRELRQKMQDWGLESDFADVEQAIRSKMSQLLINEVSHVITWGSTHYHSNLMRIASSHLGLECLNLERGLIPNSWVLSRGQQLRNLVKFRQVQKDDLESVREFAILSIVGFDKYPVESHEVQNKEPNQKSINIFGGFPTGAGLKKAEYQHELDSLLATVLNISDGIPVGLRLHPAYPIPAMSGQKILDLGAGRISETFTQEGVNVFFGTTTSAMAIVLGLPATEISTTHQRKIGFVHQVRFPLEIEKVASYETLKSHAEETFDENLKHVLQNIGESHILHPLADGGSSIRSLIREFSQKHTKESNVENSEISWPKIQIRSKVLTEVESNRSKHRELKNQHEELKNQHEELKNQHEELKNQHEELKNQHQSVLMSTSWLITQPLRRFLKIFRSN